MLEKVRLMVVCDEEGRELWRRGEGKEWSKSAVKEAIKEGRLVVFEDIPTKGGPETAVRLLLKSVVVIPVEEGGKRFYVYFDSGEKVRFSQEEIWQIVGMARWVIREEEKEKEKEAGRLFVGRSVAAEEVKRKILEAAQGGHVFIEGETGTGKGVVARLIHEVSEHKGKFVHVNCASLPHSLFESELFGHRRGAFTDAKEEKIGLVEAAAGGTLFLDEITEVPLDLQGKLLRFVETGRFRRLGETRERGVEVRIIAATNRAVGKAISEGRLRPDLFYRLSQHHIVIPPLRKRKEDIDALLEYYGGLLRGRRLSKGALSRIKAYSFPGNVRELLTLLQRLGARREPEEVSAEEVEKELSLFRRAEPEEKKDEIDELWAKIERGGNFWEVVKKPFLARDLNRSQVKEFLRRGLIKSGWCWKELCEMVNLSPEEYHKFMRFIHEQSLKP